ncbi:hydroxymethylbilane synthase [Robertkochia marina]|uniref:Hydroxymethylbilane synthase n=1 Tax=Robertkochia marina TaxID=1227945 RepID=A0A4S3M407_9FLAO|nr:hydroxymethylbilane synthase [Robertkochia marina]THD69419.1 hydroxymethylbilane synthase [Robertkochia marina]TRZ47320.1 hydroxymethylbilane synthase [Robertkochia marina]
MNKIIRIGTRDSELAMWQARHVQQKLEALGYQTSLVPVKSTGDIVLDKPLYELGITGIFTKTLDVALLKEEIDIAVHSMKDVPTALPSGIVKAAVLKRANSNDILVVKNGTEFLDSKKGHIATGSLRRKAQWLSRYPKHQVSDLRGNVNSRMRKLEENPWDGAIFASAGLERINLKPENAISLDWMVPAPAQGAMMIAALEKDQALLKVLHKLNDYETDICTTIERDFLRTLEGGCTAPIGALATVDVDYLHFKGVLHSLNGKQKAEIEKKVLIENIEGLGAICAREILMNGGDAIMKKIKKALAN